MYTVDARGLSCPEPLMMTQEALKKHANEQVKVMVSEVHTRDNVEKFAKSQKRSVTITQKGSEFEILIQ